MRFTTVAITTLGLLFFGAALAVALEPSLNVSIALYQPDVAAQVTPVQWYVYEPVPGVTTYGYSPYYTYRPQYYYSTPPYSGYYVAPYSGGYYYYPSGPVIEYRTPRRMYYRYGY